MNAEEMKATIARRSNGINCNTPYTCDVCSQTIERTDGRIRTGELDERFDPDQKYPLNDLIFVCGTCVGHGYHLQGGRVQGKR